MWSGRREGGEERRGSERSDGVWREWCDAGGRRVGFILVRGQSLTYVGGRLRAWAIVFVWDKSIQKPPFRQKPGDLSSLVWNPPSIHFEMLFGYVIRNLCQRLYEHLPSTCRLLNSITSASPCDNHPSPPSLCPRHKVHPPMWIRWLSGYDYDSCDHSGLVHYVVWRRGGRRPLLVHNWGHGCSLNAEGPASRLCGLWAPTESALPFLYGGASRE